MLLARSINPSAPALFHAKLSPHARSSKGKKPTDCNGCTQQYSYSTNPKKLEWSLTPELRAGIRFAETRLSGKELFVKTRAGYRLI
jgi:carnitine O-acetyltransferase